MKFIHAAVISALVAGLSCEARAADWFTGSESPDASSGSFEFDSSVSATSQGDRSLAIVGTVAPFTKSDQSGMRFSIEGDVGDYNYVSAAPGVGRVSGEEESGSALVGWKWVGDNVNAAAYVGAEARSDHLDRYDPDNPNPGTEIGAKVGGEVYSNPTPYTMAFAQASYSTVRSAYYTHFKFGLAVADNVFIGPEALYLGDDFYRQWRLGAHLSGVEIGALQFGISGGVLEDHTRGAGSYGSLDLRLAF